MQIKRSNQKSMGRLGRSVVVVVGLEIKTEITSVESEFREESEDGNDGGMSSESKTRRDTHSRVSSAKLTSDMDRVRATPVVDDDLYMNAVLCAISKVRESRATRGTHKSNRASLSSSSSESMRFGSQRDGRRARGRRERGWT